MKRLFFLALVCASSLSFGDTFLATFDELAEGQFGPEMVSGGVRLYDVDQNLGGGDDFCIEWANSGTLGPDFSAPNVCGFGGYVPGSGVAFGRIKSFSIGMAGGGNQLKSIGFDFWTFLLQSPGNRVTVKGWLGNVLVDWMSYTPSTFVVDHVYLSLPEDDYDRFTVECTGDIDNGVLFANVDNVRLVGNPVPEPSGWVSFALASGLILLRARRIR